MTADPKPAKRIVDPDAGAAKMAREGRCRICGADRRYTVTTRHHLIPRSQGGDDIDDNLVPLCGHGTVGCHGRIEAGHLSARGQLRAALTDAEVAYCVRVVGEARFDRRYPRVERMDGE